MGVKGLWTLLSACGRCIPLDALTSRVLAIDVSLWLVQFLKAMRSEDGQVRQDAHLIGMFKRICRLLLFGIRPVFVYDGPPPMLKRKTLALRRRLRDSSELRWQRTAEKILLTQLKLKTIQELRKQIEQSANAPVDPEALKDIAESVESERINQATKDEFAELFESDEEEAGDCAAFVDADVLNRREIIVPESIDVMDPEALAALPYSMQYEVLEKLREDRAHESRARHIASANAPSAFSSTQLNQFLETSAFNRKINEVRSRVGGSSVDASSQGIATMPDTLFYFHKTPTAKKSGKRQRQELLRAAKRDGKPAITLSDYHMETWTCLKCGLSNLAIRRSCQKCGHGYGQSVITWDCSICSTANSEQNSHCLSCFQVRKSTEQTSSPEVRDRTAEIDALFDDSSLDAQIEPTAEEPSVDDSCSLQDIASSETGAENGTVGTESAGSDLLTIRNSRLNFYRLQRKSSITYSQEEASRLGTAVAPITRGFDQRSSTGAVTLSPDDNDIRDSGFVEPRQILSDTSDIDSGTTERLGADSDVHEEDAILFRGSEATVSIQSPVDKIVQGDIQESKAELSSQDVLLPASAPMSVSELLHPAPVSVEVSQSPERPTSEQFLEFVPGNSLPLFEYSVIAPISTQVLDSQQELNLLSEEPLTKSSQIPLLLSDLVQSNATVNEFRSNQAVFSQPAPRPPPIPSLTLDIDEAKVMDDLADMRSSQLKNLRDADHVTDEMIQETQTLLRLFGVPFVCAPAEAEAQCAALEILGLVDGVVTDDSDVFLFGARNVYRNMFSSDKTVERYQMPDIEHEIGVDREKLIRMALLLGSDYTDGIHGIGIVNAIEIVNSFTDLTEFREWVYSDSVVEGNVPDIEEPDERLVRLRKFKFTHRNIRRNWQVPRDFPDEQVATTYLEPLVDKSEEKFSWSQPNIIRLKQFCQEHLQWNIEKTESLLAPVLRKLQDSTYQTRLEAFFGTGEKAAKIKSKRIKLAVNELISRK